MFTLGDADVLDDVDTLLEGVLPSRDPERLPLTMLCCDLLPDVEAFPALVEGETTRDRLPRSHRRRSRTRLHPLGR